MSWNNSNNVCWNIQNWHYCYYRYKQHNVFDVTLTDNYRLIHALFHIRTVIIQREWYRSEGFSPRVDIGRGMITVLKWKKACSNLFITYFNIELKRAKLTSHTDTKLIWIWVIDIGWGMITVLLWKKLCIDLFIERLDIVLSEFCPNICPWADIAVALPVFTHGQNWHHYL
jgi:hypothetical protein